MRKSNLIIGAVFIGICILFIACNENASSTKGKIIISQGKVEIIRNNNSMPAKVGTIVLQGDIIKTGKDGVAVVRVKKSQAEFEIQNNTEFEIKHVGSGQENFILKAGGVWTKVNKLLKNDAFSLDTPTATLGVRGTKFYVFQLGDMHVVCHCQGDVNFLDKGNNTSSIHEQDHLVFTRNNKTIILSPEELKDVGFAHNHSVLSNSPLGPKNTMNKEVFKKVMALVNKKFKELK